ncbi:MAG: DUF domain-containing protein, partial [Terracidiphilus sp.]|nr:DUF domain-containing protein [Terracidiphilus sp.]
MPPKSRDIFAQFTEEKDDNGALIRRRCRRCSHTYKATSSSSSLLHHLNHSHVAWMLKKEPAAVTIVEDDMQMEDAPPTAAAAAPDSSSASIATDSDASFRSPPRPPARPHSVADLLATQGQQSVLQVAAIAFAKNGIAHRVVQTPSFSALLAALGWRGAPPTRRSLREALLAHATSLRTRLISRLRNSQTAVSVAIDGWTNVRHDKVTNVLVLQGGQAFYWCSITNDAESNTADWLASRLRPVLDTLMSTHRVRVVALVADNEAVMGALHTRLERDYPFLIRVPCAAHTIQLAVRDCLASDEHARTVSDFLSFVKHFEKKEHRHALLELQRARKVPPLVLRKPNDTRWNSLFLAIERALEMQPELECCMPPHLHQQRDDFFTRLHALTEFLHPFRAATDTVQRDTATLSDVRAQFGKLLAHVRNSKFSSDAVLQRWQDFVNRDAVVACCILSFTPVPEGHDVQSALAFIRSFGTEYLTFYGASSLDAAVLSARLWQQIG